MIKTKYLVIGTVSLLTACAHPKKDKQPEEQFTMYITENNIKQFQLSVVMPDNKHGGAKRGSKGSKGGRGGGGRNKGGDDRHMGNYDVVKHKPQNKKLNERVEFHLAKTAYCREGYIETDNFRSADEIIIRGRCNDKATAKDRKKLNQ